MLWLFRLIWLVSVVVLITRITNTLLIDKNNHEVELIVSLGHKLIYVFMVGCVISGYMMASDDLFFFPSTYSLYSDESTLHLAHKIFTYGLGILVAGHIGMALYHQFIKKEALLQKMFR